jgi:metallophosphoesterase superfamily enzyme
LLSSLTTRLDWRWITGNHDAALVTDAGGIVQKEALVDGILMRHEADPADPRPELSGHFHPKLRIRLRGQNVARRCFVASATKLILPAFGALTGGLDAGHAEIRRVIGPGAQALVALSDRLLRFPLAA